MSDGVFKVALVVDSEYVPAWQRLLLERLSALAGVSVVAAIFRSPLRDRQGLGQYLLRVLRWLDAWLFQCQIMSRCKVNWLDSVGDICFCEMDGVRCQQLLAETPVDMVLDLTGQTPSASLRAWAKHGVWRHFYGNPAGYRDDEVGVREYLGKHAVVVSGLERCLGSEEKPECIFYTTTSTNPVSINRSMEHTLWKMADFVPSQVQRLLQRVDASAVSDIPLMQRDTRTLTLWVVLQVFGRYSRNLLVKFYKAIFQSEQWILLLGGQQRAVEPLALDNFRQLMPPRDRFWADPFVVEHADGQYLFFEEFLYERGVGHISCMKLNPDGSQGEAVKVLERSYHLSYPFIFMYQGQYYMIPETADNRSIELFRCDVFPHHWVFEKTLMNDVEAYDATLCEHQGRWWLFASMRKHTRCLTNELLYLFYADNPLSNDWRPHPQNPVVTQAENARPAGRIIEENGCLYRPAQNCAGTYGRGLNINLIRRIDTTGYQEEMLTAFAPEGEQGLAGMHTLAISPTLCVSDALYVHHRLGAVGQWLSRLAHA
jgi:hypothetical protein